VLFIISCSITTMFSPLSLHDALPIYSFRSAFGSIRSAADAGALPQAARPVRLCRSDHAVRRGEEERHHDDRLCDRGAASRQESRSEEHTSELQSLRHLVCRLLLEKKK